MRVKSILLLNKNNRFWIILNDWIFYSWKILLRCLQCFKGRRSFESLKCNHMTTTTDRQPGVQFWTLSASLLSVFSTFVQWKVRMCWNILQLLLNYVRRFKHVKWLKKVWAVVKWTWLHLRVHAVVEMKWNQSRRGLSDERSQNFPVEQSHRNRCWCRSKSPSATNYSFSCGFA